MDEDVELMTIGDCRQAAKILEIGCEICGRHGYFFTHEGKTRYYAFVSELVNDAEWLEIARDGNTTNIVYELKPLGPNRYVRYALAQAGIVRNRDIGCHWRSGSAGGRKENGEGAGVYALVLT